MGEFVLAMYIRKSWVCSCRIRWTLLCFGYATAYILEEVRGIAFAVEVNLLAQCWFCTVCVKRGMAESLNSGACQAFLEDLVYWRHKWVCSAELLFFYEAVIHNPTYFWKNTFNEESEMCSWCWNIFQRFLYLYMHTHRFLDTSVMYTTARHSDEGDYAFTGCMKPK